MKQFKKILAMGLCLFVGLGTLSGCGAGGVSSTDGDNSESGDSSEKASNVVAGLICLHDENAPYDQNFISAFRESCEKAGIPNVSYNGSMLSACPNTCLVSSRINWSPYYNYAMDAVKEGKAIDTDWTGTMDTDSVL